MRRARGVEAGSEACARIVVLGVGAYGSLEGDQPQGARMPRNRMPTLRAEDLMRIARQVDDTVRELKGVVSWLVLEAHDRGATWDEIGTAFGVSRQAAHERFGPNSRALRRVDRRDARAGHR